MSRLITGLASAAMAAGLIGVLQLGSALPARAHDNSLIQLAVCDCAGWDGAGNCICGDSAKKGHRHIRHHVRHPKVKHPKPVGQG
jgi:hypothetical protein